MRTLVILLVVSIGCIFIGWFSYGLLHRANPEEVVEETSEVLAKPLEKYQIEKMKNASWQNGTFTIEKKLGEEEKYTSYFFSLQFYPEIEGNKSKKTTGQINIPKGDGTFPIVLMFRGYVDETVYTTGTGTRPAAKYFAENGFITIAPDFLGYAESDSEAGDIFESRFQTYTTAISLLKTIEKFKTDKNSPRVSSGLDESSQLTNLLINFTNLSLWAHSNGGQIALTTLAVTEANYPLTLWAPASKPFPYVVLYFTDESEDGGKFIRKELAKLENIYDVDTYSYTNYLKHIQSPIQIHQGTADTAVPVSWSSELVGRLRKAEKDVTYFTYPGADHNLRPNWDEVVEKDVVFFKENMS